MSHSRSELSRQDWNLPESGPPYLLTYLITLHTATQHLGRLPTYLYTTFYTYHVAPSYVLVLQCISHSWNQYNLNAIVVHNKIIYYFNYTYGLPIYLCTCACAQIRLKSVFSSTKNQKLHYKLCGTGHTKRRILIPDYIQKLMCKNIGIVGEDTEDCYCSY